MSKTLVKKLLYAILIFFGVSCLTFALGRMAPGDGLDTYLNTDERIVTEEDLAHAREDLGLDKPIPQQYIDWLGKISKGDWGISYSTKKTVTHEIMIRLPNTIILTFMSLSLGLLIAVLTALLCTVKSGSAVDHILRIINTVVIAVPTFCIGLLVMYVLGVKLKWFPIVSGTGIIRFIMPTITLGVGMSGGMIRYFRTHFLEIWGSEHILYARAMGVKTSEVFCKHVLLPLLPQLIVYVGLRFAGLLGGSYIIESMFSLNGAGWLLVSSVSSRDYPMIQGYAVLMAAIYITVRLVSESIALLMDPRQRLHYGEAL